MRYIGFLIIAIAVIICTLLAAATLRYKFRSGETITVTGLAEKDFVSDQIVWKGTFTRSGADLKIDVLQSGGRRDLFTFSSGLFEWHDGLLNP